MNSKKNAESGTVGSDEEAGSDGGGASKSDCAENETDTTEEDAEENLVAAITAARQALSTGDKAKFVHACRASFEQLAFWPESIAPHEHH
jgi:hypothetical protein